MPVAALLTKLEQEIIKEPNRMLYSDVFEGRKLVNYKNKPLFSIFRIGDDAFAPYKVAILGLYKTSRFALVLPYQAKPMMLDDTCYFLGCE